MLFAVLFVVLFVDYCIFLPCYLWIFYGIICCVIYFIICSVICCVICGDICGVICCIICGVICCIICSVICCVICCIVCGVICSVICSVNYCITCSLFVVSFEVFFAVLFVVFFYQWKQVVEWPGPRWGQCGGSDPLLYSESQIWLINISNSVLQCLTFLNTETLLHTNQTHTLTYHYYTYIPSYKRKYVDVSS